jgi:hypothetical protein
MVVSSREKASQRTPWPVQSLALGTHWRTSAVLRIASSTAGTKRTRSCSPAALPSPHGRRVIPLFFFFFLFFFIALVLVGPLRGDGVGVCSGRGVECDEQLNDSARYMQQLAS